MRHTIKTLIIASLIASCGGGASSTKEPVITPIVEPVVESAAKQTFKVAHRGLKANTLDGFSYSIDKGFLHVEADLRLRNGEVVLLHDNIKRDDYESLEQLLSLLEGKGIVLWLEFKEPETISPALDLIAQYSTEVLLTSFKVADIDTVHSLSNYETGIITQSALTDYNQADWVITNDASYCLEYLKCAIWTIKSQKDYDNLTGLVDAIIVDEY